MCHYNHFTTEEREKSRVLKAQGLSIREIVNSQSKCNSSKEAALSAKNSSINFKKKAKNNKKGG